jgi:hypothetical protein
MTDAENPRHQGYGHRHAGQWGQFEDELEDWVRNCVEEEDNQRKNDQDTQEAATHDHPS